MFDVSFSELVVIGVVALIVIGPERLPRVARTAGHLLGRARRYVDDVKADIHREIQMDELKKMQDEMLASARQLEDSMREQLATTEAMMAGDDAKAGSPPAATESTTDPTRLQSVDAERKS